MGEQISLLVVKAIWLQSIHSQLQSHIVMVKTPPTKHKINHVHARMHGHTEPNHDQHGKHPGFLQ